MDNSSAPKLLIAGDPDEIVGDPDEPEYHDVLIFKRAVAVQFDNRSPYLVVTPDGAVTERYTLGGIE